MPRYLLQIFGLVLGFLSIFFAITLMQSDISPFAVLPIGLALGGIVFLDIYRSEVSAFWYLVWIGIGGMILPMAIPFQLGFFQGLWIMTYAGYFIIGATMFSITTFFHYHFSKGYKQ